MAGNADGASGRAVWSLPIEDVAGGGIGLGGALPRIGIHDARDISEEMCKLQLQPRMFAIDRELLRPWHWSPHRRLRSAWNGRPIRDPIALRRL